MAQRQPPISSMFTKLPSQGLKIHNSLFCPEAAALGKTGLVSTALPSVMVVWKRGIRAHWVP